MELSYRKDRKLALDIGIYKYKTKKEAEYAESEEEGKCLAVEAARECEE